MIGIEDRFWSLERFHGPIFGMEVFWEGAQLTSGIFWFHEEQQFLVGICVASWLHHWLGQIFLQPWWLIVFVGLYLQLTYVQFAWFLPFFLLIQMARFRKIYIITRGRECDMDWVALSHWRSSRSNHFLALVSIDTTWLGTYCTSFVLDKGCLFGIFDFGRDQRYTKWNYLYNWK